MFARFYPITSRYLDRLRKAAPLEALAVDHKVLHPEETSPIPGIVMDPDQRSKVTRAQEDTDLGAEWARVDGRPQVRHGATVIYEFRKVLATPRGLFKATGAPCAHGRPDLSELMRASVVRRTSGFFPLPSYGIPYFAHWLLDGLPTLALRAPQDALFLPIPASWSHARAYSELLELDPVPDRYAFFERMFFAEDLGKNASLRHRMRALRSDLQERIGGAGGQRVYIRRTGGQQRSLVNEDLLVAALEREGFVIVADTDPLDRILAAANRASIVVGVEGSHLAHFLLPATEDTVLITINPADRFNNYYADYAGALGGHQATVVAARDGAGYRTDIDHLMGFVDRMAGQAARLARG